MDWQIEEPRIEWTGDIAWDSVTRTLVSRDGQLVSSSLASSFRDWFWTADPRQTSKVGGLAALRIDLARLASMSRPGPNSPPRMSPVGQMSGTVKLSAQSDEVMTVLDMSGQNIRLQKMQPALPGAAPTIATIWQEPRLRVVGTLGYAAGTDRLRINELRTISNTLAVAANGIRRVTIYYSTGKSNR